VADPAAPAPGAGTSGPLLRVDNLEAAYGPVLALRGVSLRVPEGGIVAVLGANGAGKTTLLRTVSGLLDPLKGTVSYAGEGIGGAPAERIVGAGLVHVPEGREVFPLLSVEENLRLGAFTRRDGAAAVARDREAALAYFPALAERLAQPAGTLSGGQQQMLAIARGLMARPRLMLLDEPSLGLSPLLAREILAIVRRLNRERRVAVLLVEQNAAAALEVAGHGYVMEMGRIVADGPADRLRDMRDVRESYLGAEAPTQRGERRWTRRKTWR
jgi:branched-chain amino acid transport system ATP-binding protein